MPNPIQILFSASGHEAVRDVFRSLKQAALDLERTQARTARTTATAQVKAANDTTKSAQQAASTRLKVEADTAKAQNQIVVAGAKRTNAAYLATLKSRLAMDRDAAKEHAKTEREMTRATERESTRRAQAEKQRTRAQASAINHRASGTSGMLNRAVRGTMGTVTGLAGSLGLAGGGMLIANGLSSAIDLERKAALLSNATSMPGMAPADPRALANQARGIAGETGFAAGDVMEAMNTVSARAGGMTGLKAFQQDLSDVARTALAAGTSMEDMAGVYAAALNAGVAPGKEMQQLMRDLVMQGKLGAVEFADLASELAKLAGAGKSWGSGGDMIKRASGLAQIAVQSAVSPEESRTAVVDMVREFTQGPKIEKLRAAGVKVEGIGGKNRDPMELLAETIHAAETKGIGGKKGQAGLSQIFTGKSQMDLIMGLRETYLTGFEGAKGADAVRARIASASGGTMSAGQRDTEFQKVMDTNAQKMAVAMENFKSKLAETLPRFTELLPAVLQATEALARLAVWATDNPFKALGGVFAMHLGKELAAAKISQIIAAAFRGGGGGAPGASTLGGAAGALGIAGASLGAGLALGSAAAADIGEGAEAGKAVMDAKYRGLEFASYYRNKATKEGLTDAERAGLVNQAKVMGTWGATAKANETIEGWDTISPDAYATRAGYRAGGGDYATPEAFAEVAKSMLEIAASAKKASDELNKVQGGSLADPGNAARGAPASSMASGRR